MSQSLVLNNQNNSAFRFLFIYLPCIHTNDLALQTTFWKKVFILSTQLSLYYYYSLFSWVPKGSIAFPMCYCLILMLFNTLLSLFPQLVFIQHVKGLSQCHIWILVSWRMKYQPPTYKFLLLWDRQQQPQWYSKCLIQILTL